MKRESGTWPDPNATRTQVDDFVREQSPATSSTWKASTLDGGTIAHEAPPIENGPSIVCSACGLVRINPFAGPFCKGCLTTALDQAGARVS